MSYNIKGLPWPLAVDRDHAIFEIGKRLAGMRLSDAQPCVVLLQEAFGDAAHMIGRAGGYRFVVKGPEVSTADASEPLGRAFAESAQWFKGEKSGSLINSGLAILSDYPVIKIARYAFPQGACAGYDCLAAKGVLVAWIKVPGAIEPIAVVDTHLNSRRAARVAIERADQAYAWQVRAVRKFLSRVIPSDSVVIFGGDFNTGQVPARIAVVSRPFIEGAQSDALRTILSRGGVILGSREEARGIVGRDKDKILFRDGKRVALRAERAWVPFPITSQAPLSDHAGFVVDLSVTGRGTSDCVENCNSDGA